MAEKTETGQASEAANQVAAGTEEMVPKSRLEEETAKVTAANEQNKLLQQNQQLIQQNAAAQANAPKVEPYDIYKDVGLDPNDPDDVPTQAQQKKINAYFQQQDNFKQSLIHTRLDHSDFNDIVGTTEQIRSGLYAAPLAAAIQADPTLRTQILNSANPYETAYRFAKTYKKQTGDSKNTDKTTAEKEIDEAVAESKRVKTSANAQGGDGLSEAGRTTNMSDTDFIKEFNQFGGDL